MLISSGPVAGISQEGALENGFLGVVFPFQVSVGNIRLETGKENQGVQVLTNTILSLMAVIKEKWSERQREVIEDMLAHPDSQANLAARLGITQPTVQKILAKGNYYVYKHALDTLKEAFKEIGERRAFHGTDVLI